MAGKVYQVLNGAAPGAAAAVPLATGTAIKTMLQVATHATTPGIRVVEWWTEFEGEAAATPIRVELLRHTGGAQTSLTAYQAADITKLNDPSAPASSVQLGTALSGFGTGAAEVTPTGANSLSTHFIPPTTGIYIQYPLYMAPEIQVAAFLRHRVTADATVGCYVGVSWEE